MICGTECTHRRNGIMFLENMLNKQKKKHSFKYRPYSRAFQTSPLHCILIHMCFEIVSHSFKKSCNHVYPPSLQSLIPRSLDPSFSLLSLFIVRLWTYGGRGTIYLWCMWTRESVGLLSDLVFGVYGPLILQFWPDETILDIDSKIAQKYL